MNKALAGIRRLLAGLRAYSRSKDRALRSAVEPAASSNEAPHAGSPQANDEKAEGLAPPARQRGGLLDHALTLGPAVFCRRHLTLFAIYGVWKILLLRTMAVASSATRGLANDWNRYLTFGCPSWAVPFANWDGQHYLLLAKNGYAAARNDSVAFYPLFPLLTKWLALATGSIFLAAFLVPTLFALVFLVLFDVTLDRLGMNEKHRFWAEVLLLSYPSAFYLTAFYSEALVLFAIMGFFYSYAVRKNRLSILFALLLPWAKGQGLFIGILPAIDLVVSAIRKQKRDTRLAFFNVLAVAVSEMALLGFYKLSTGNAFAHVEAQGQFVFHISIANIFSPSHFLLSFFSASHELFDYNNSIADKLFIGLTFLGFVPVAFSKDWKVIVTFLALVVPTAMMGDGSSFIRHSLLAWPFIVLSTIRQGLLGRVAICMLAALLLMVQLYLATRFATNLWVG